jgi:DNA-directed DNA polymerase III PolC
MIAAARAVGAATLAVPDVYCAWPAGYGDHRLRVAIKHTALVQDLPEQWLAELPTHLLAPAEMSALYADLPEVAGPFAPAGASPRSAKGSAAQTPGAVARTLAVAAECNFAPVLGENLFPTIELEAGQTAASKLRALALSGAERRYRPLRTEVLHRLDYELVTIERLGFAPYFLLVNQIADFAREQKIPCVGRGSAADSLVSYCLGLTDADPLRYKLAFERFLNPARRDRPDIDLDFCWRRRDEVLEHVYGLFGTERTAMISTLNHFGPRAAFREAALVEGIPPAEVNRWSRRLPHFAPLPTAAEARTASRREDARAPLSPELGLNPLARALHTTPEAARFPFDDPRYERVLGAAARLLGVPRHYGLHPGGVVVAPGSITDFVACQRAAKGVVVTQLDKDAVEAIGLVKMDLLGNRALTVIDDCTQELAARGVVVDLEAIPEDDARTAATLREGRTLGCFQVESPGMRNLLKQTGAATMDSVIQAVAMIRPGPASSGMKDAYVRRFRGLEPPHPPHPRLTDILWETQGVMLYQEDVMQVAACIAGMDLSEADLLRRALQKRRAHELEPLCARFLSGAAQQGIARADALRVWDLVANFASFGFCKAHAVTYGRIAYRAVWLKTYYPAVFLASFLASETGYYDARVYVEEARRLGVPILPPDVNRSGRTFAVEWEADRKDARASLRIGLGQVKGLSERTLAAIVQARGAHGPFLSLPDFLERTRAQSDETERLIQCGAFDAFDRTRPELLWRLHLLNEPRRRPRPGPAHDLAREREPLDILALEACRATPASRARDALSAARARTGGWQAHGIGLGAADLARGESAALFPQREVPALALPRLPDLDWKTRARLEFELLGLTVRVHPVAVFPCPADERRASSGQRPANVVACGRLDHFRAGRITLRAWPVASRPVRTQNGRSMRFLTLEDESGIAEVVLFPDVYERDGERLSEFGTLCITGRVEDQMGACTLHAERIW